MEAIQGSLGHSQEGIRSDLWTPALKEWDNVCAWNVCQWKSQIQGFFFQLYANTPANKRGKYDAIEILAFYIHSLICREVTGREGNGIEW